jgi:hypothetical protein
MFYSDILSARPNFGIVGRIFIQTDSPYGIYRDTGTAWDLISNVSSSPAGAVFAVDTTNGGLDKSIAYWQDQTGGGGYTFDINADANFVYDYTTGFVGIGTFSPAYKLTIEDSVSNIVAINNNSINNTFLKFQRAGTDVWTIGNKRSQNSSFVITDEVSAIDRLQLFNTGESDLNGYLVVTNNATGLTGTTTPPNCSISNNFLWNNGISTSPSVNTIGLDADNNLTFNGSATFNQTSYNTGFLGRTIFRFSGVGSTITYTQATGIRALTNQQLIYIQTGTNSGTISDYANFQIFGDQKLSTGLTTFTNRYQILLNDYDEFTAGFTYTNRWAIFQKGASNTNYFNGKIITGSSTTIGTYQLDVTGTSQFTGNLTFNTGNFTGISTHTIQNTFAGATTNVNTIVGISYLNTTTGASASSTYGIYNYIFLDVTGGSSNSNLYSQYNVASIRGLATNSLLSGFGAFIGINRTDPLDISTNANNTITALSIQASHGISTGSASINSSTMSGNNIQMSVSAGTITNVYGNRIINSIGTNNNSLANTITNLYGFRVNFTLGSTIYGASLVTNYYGLYIDTPIINATGTLTNRWGVYAPDSAMNHSIVGSVIIGTATLTASALLSMSSTTKGFLPPVMTKTQRNAISSPASGLLVVNSTDQTLDGYDGTAVTWYQSVRSTNGYVKMDATTSGTSGGSSGQHLIVNINGVNYKITLNNV